MFVRKIQFVESRTHLHMDDTGAGTALFHFLQHAGGNECANQLFAFGLVRKRSRIRFGLGFWSSPFAARCRGQLSTNRIRAIELLFCGGAPPNLRSNMYYR